MKLRVRFLKQTSCLELPGEDPTLSELADHIKQTVLPSRGLSANTEFSLSLNGKESIPDNGQTLSSCSIVSGDLICVLLLERVDAVNSSFSASTEKASNSAASRIQPQHMTAMSYNDPSCSSSSVYSDESQHSEVSDPEHTFASWEPMLCSEAEDGQAPLSLELLFPGAHCTSPSDAVIVVGHLLMLETGFTHEVLPAGWRGASGFYKLKYTHALCENSLVTLAAVCTGPTLVINATFKVNETANAVGKLCLNPSIYVTNEWPGDHAAAAFKDLKRLSRIFKDQLAYPLIAAAREAMGLPVAFGLPVLPPELLLRVLRLLDVHSLARLSAVSKHFHNATSDSTLWKHLFLRDFRGTENRPRDTNWRELYKRHYKNYKERQQLRHHRSLPLYPSPEDIFAVPDFPAAVPGIIGGVYDQRPALPRVLLPRPRYDPIGPFQSYTPRSGGRDRGFI
uniref:F-box protein 7 n=1 Tax=Neogobius melanostomus TaxID=47308 RepID=A0A8C6UXM8_9GOBI